MVFSKRDIPSILFLEVSCLADMSMLEKEEKKTNGYQPLVRQMRQMYNQPVVPIVFWVTGIVSKNQRTYLKKIPFQWKETFCHLTNGWYILETTFFLQGLNMIYLSESQFPEIEAP